MLTPPEVDARLREIALLDLDIETRGIRLARALERIKARAQEEIEPLRRKRDEAEAELVAECRTARATLFPDDSKTLAVGAGKVSWRYKPPRVELLEGVTEDQALRHCMRNQPMFIRTYEVLDKAEVLKIHAAGEIKDKDLERLGLVVIRDEEVWSLKPDVDAVREAVGKP